MFLKTCPAARPSLRAVSAVTGSMLAVPRTPSVPKIFLGWLMIESSIPVIAGRVGRGDPLHGDLLGHDADGDHIGGHIDVDPFLGKNAVIHVGQVNKRRQV